jgi:hypothetical protein
MKRSKELFEYLKQHGMYTRGAGEEVESAPAGQASGPETPLSEASTRQEPPRRARKPRKESRPAAGGRRARSFGDRTLQLTYNNLALGGVFFASLLVLCYFLGFSQGIGDFNDREHQIRMDTIRGNAAEPGGPEDLASADRGNPTGDPAEDPAVHRGFLDDQRVVWSVRVYTANASSRVYAEEQVNFLSKRGYDARITEQGERVIVHVGRFDRSDSEEARNLLDRLRELKAEYPETGEPYFPYEKAYIEEIRP